MRTPYPLLLLAAVSIGTAQAANTTPVATTTTIQPAVVEMQTSVGTVTIQLDWDKAPISSKFLGLYRYRFLQKYVLSSDLFGHRYLKTVQKQ
jgi:hypothetical protein